MIVDLVLLAVLIPLGMGAGGLFEPRWLPRVIIGVIFGYLLLGLDWWLLAFAPLVYTGGAPGVGQPKGYIADGKEPQDGKMERWQPERLRHHPYISLQVRGLFFGLPLLAVILTRKVPKKKEEWIFLAGAILCAALAVYQPTLLVIGPGMAIAVPVGIFLSRQSIWLWEKLVHGERFLSARGEHIWRVSEAWQYFLAGILFLML